MAASAPARKKREMRDREERQSEREGVREAWRSLTSTPAQGRGSSQGSDAGKVEGVWWPCIVDM
jgi:hypothetical protein